MIRSFVQSVLAHDLRFEVSGFRGGSFPAAPYLATRWLRLSQWHSQHSPYAVSTTLHTKRFNELYHYAQDGGSILHESVQSMQIRLTEAVLSTRPHIDARNEVSTCLFVAVDCYRVQRSPAACIAEQSCTKLAVREHATAPRLPK